MTKPANKARGEVAVPELGDGVFLRFTVDALERLESKYDDKENGWLMKVIDGLSSMKMSVIRTCIEVSLVGDVDVDFDNVGGVDVICDRILDAMFLMLYRRTFAEQKEFEEKKQLDELARRVKSFNSDPHLAAVLFLKQSEGLATKQDSDQTNSAA